MSFPPLLNGPIPPYNNPPIEPQFFQPSVFVITAVSLGITTTITCSVNHNYVIGQIVRLNIPTTFGCTGLNQQLGNVISIPAANQVTLDIFSIGNNPFQTSTATTQPQIIAVGDENNGIISSTGRVVPTTAIPGSFINISPL